MAAQTAIRTQHATLSGTTADSVTLSHTSGSELTVTNHDATTTLYFRQDGTTAVAAADETYHVLPLQTKTVPFQGGVISVVGNGNVYSVETY